MTRNVALALLAFATLVAVLGVVRLRTVPEASAWTRMRRSDLVVSVDVTGVLRAVESVELGPPLLVRMSEFTITKLAPEGGPA